MSNINTPEPAELPSTAKLLKSTGIAVAIASVVLVTVILPAEYGVDPTRIGSVFGLTEMGRIKRQLAAEAAADAASTAAIAPTASPNAATIPATGAVAPAAVVTPETPAPAETAPMPATAAATTPTAAPAPAPAGRSDRTSLTLEPDEGAEIKLAMRNGARANFTWSTDGAEVNYDTHGDGEGVTYHGYGKGTAARQSGVMTAAFAGHHGWFWRNRSGEPVTITLQTSGDYESVDFVE
ncbi:hypothetical protein BH09PSE1_BH09PSE1_02080 [soil metagenome]